jgi:polysaccharide chain length determinant protein (PEP-CTERM system associated)
MHILQQARRYIRAGWRHRWKALALAWLVCLLGWAGVQSLPDQYQASTRVYADADAVLGQLLRGIAVDSSPANQVDLLQRTLLSRPNLERVIARTDLDMRIDSTAAREQMLTALAKDIRITAQTRNLFTITYSDTDPKLARDVVQTLLNLFIEQASSNDRQQMDNARSFVAQQLAVYETQLREAERRRADFRARYIDLLPDAGGVTGLEQARARLRQLRGELEDARQRRALTQQQLDATPAQLVVESAAGPGGESRLAEAERALRELRLRYTEQHPDVVAARKAIAELRAGGGGGGATGRVAGGGGPRANPLHEQLKLRLVDADATIVSLDRQIREAEATVERLESVGRTMPQVEAQFQNLDRDYNVLRKNYEELLERREAVQIAGAARAGAERVRLEVVDPPVVPNTPTGPKRLLLSSVVLIAGIGAGLALPFLLVMLDGSFYTLRDLRAIGLPVLGGISAADPEPRRVFPALAFAGGFALLLAAFGTVLAGGASLLAKLPALVERFTA